MIKYVIKRILLLIPVFFGVTFVIFAIVRMNPADPVVAILGINITEEQYAAKAAELGAKELDIISDSLLLVKQYLGEYKIKHPDLAARMAEIRALAAPFHISIRHVLRHLNKEPDALANKAMDLKQSVGFNPIKNLNPASKTPDNIVNGVPVEPVKREPAPAAAKSKPAKNKKAVQPSLFDGF